MGTVIVLGVLLVAVYFAVKHVRKKGVGCDCSSCPSASSCASKK